MPRTKKPPFSAFGRFISKAMEQRGISNLRLARLLDMRVDNLTRVRAGERLFTWRMCVVAAPYLGVTADDLADKMQRYVPFLKELRKEFRHAVPLADLVKSPVRKRSRASS